MNAPAIIHDPSCAIVLNGRHACSCEPTDTLWQCNAAATCERSGECAAGKPHPRDSQSNRPYLCYDHKPYVPGGVYVYNVPTREGVRERTHKMA